MRNYKIKSKKYSTEKLIEAIRCVESQEMNASQAARFFEIPRMTIVNHLNGRCKGFRRGRHPVFTTSQERKIVEILHTMADMAIPLDSTGLRNVVKNFVIELNINTPFKNNTPGLDWVYS